MNKLLATVDEVFFTPFRGAGDIGQPTNNPVGRTATVLSGVIGFITLAAVVYFVIRIVLAGFGWMTAGGDAQKVQAAQQTLWQSVLGITIIFLAMAFVGLLGYLLGGIDLLDLNIITTFFDF
ncbi:MAG: hypothetical protein ABIB61_04505 [Candidatus Shapirobacteria bacterium]